MDRQVCPYCDQPIRLNNWRRHVESCARRPEDDDLIALWWELGNLSRVADMLRVDNRTLRRWYCEAGFDTSHPPVLGSPPVRPPLAGAEFAPRYGKAMQGCNGCPDHFNCRRRMRVDLWCLCCIPSQWEVAWAYRDGRIGFDGRLPEWLPALLEVMA